MEKKIQKKIKKKKNDVTERFESTIDRQINERATSYEKGTKLRKSYKVTNVVRSYEKGTKCYEISYERPWL